MAGTVLITGGSGLLALNWAVAMRDRSPVTLGIHRRTVSLAGVQTRPLDLASVDPIVRALDAIEPRFVVHAAGLTNVDQCEAEPELAQHVNVDLAVNVARACARLGVQFVLVSSDHLFAGDTALVDEAHPVAPKNVYARTKAESEARVLEAHAASLVVRTNFYGWGPSYRRSFSDVILDALRSGAKPTLFHDVFFTPILIEPAARAVHDLVDLKSSGIFHVVADERISKYEFGRRIAREFELDEGLVVPVALADRPSLVRRPHDMSLSNRKASARLGRRIGGVDEQLARLHQQERSGQARELRNL